MSARRGVLREFVCAILTSGRRINEGPGTFLERTPGLLQARAYEGAFPLPLCPQFAALSSAACGFMGASEKSYRLYSCARCARQVRICGYCDRGNRYCAAGCARIRRRESLRRASQRYQESYRGACQHAARQRAWRQRHAQKVTHQGSQASAVAFIVASISTTTQGTYADTASVRPQPPTAARRARARLPIHHAALPPPRCGFCGCVLSHFARFGASRARP